MRNLKVAAVELIISTGWWLLRLFLRPCIWVDNFEYVGKLAHEVELYITFNVVGKTLHIALVARWKDQLGKAFARCSHGFFFYTPYGEYLTVEANLTSHTKTCKRWLTQCKTNHCRSDRDASRRSILWDGALWEMNVYVLLLDEVSRLRLTLSKAVVQKVARVCLRNLTRLLHHFSKRTCYTERAKFTRRGYALITSSCLYVKYATANRVVGQSNHDTRWRISVDLLAIKTGAPNVVLQILRLHADAYAARVIAVHYSESNFFHDTVCKLLKTSDACLACVILNNEVTRLVGQLKLGGVVLKACILYRLRKQEAFEDVALFRVRVACNFDDFHAIENRRVQCVEHVGCAKKKHLGEIDRDVEKVVCKRVVLLGVKDFKERRAWVPV